MSVTKEGVRDKTVMFGNVRKVEMPEKINSNQMENVLSSLACSATRTLLPLLMAKCYSPNHIHIYKPTQVSVFRSNSMDDSWAFLFPFICCEKCVLHAVSCFSRPIKSSAFSGDDGWEKREEKRLPLTYAWPMGTGYMVYAISNMRLRLESTQTY